MKKPQVCLALGGNVGDVPATLSKALKRIDSLKDTSVLEVSFLYSTAPVGGPSQPDFLNGAALLETSLTPAELMTALLQIEKELGRVREIQDGPRTVDLDLLLWDDLVLDTPLVTLPHPRLHQRAFVLVPLAQIAPLMLHPVLKKTVAELLAGLGPVSGVRKTDIRVYPQNAAGGAGA